MSAKRARAKSWAQKRIIVQVRQDILAAQHAKRLGQVIQVGTCAKAFLL